MKSKIKSFFLPLIGITAITHWTSCSTKKTDEPEQQFLVQTAIPKTYELRDGVYPVDTCMPFQLQATDASGTPLALKNKTTIALHDSSVSDESAKNIQVSFYSGGNCDTKIEQSVLPAAESPSASMVKIYIKAFEVGKASLSFSYGGGSWSATDMLLLDFERRTRAN